MRLSVTSLLKWESERMYNIKASLWKSRSNSSALSEFDDVSRSQQSLNLVGLVSSSNHSVPWLVDLICQIINNAHLKADAIFRQSCLLADRERLVEELGNSDYSGLFSADPHVLANTLKLWLTSTPLPIFSFEVYSLCLSIGCSKLRMDPGSNTQQTRMRHCRYFKEISSIIRSLPRDRRNLLMAILNLISCLSQHSADNHMTLGSLAVVFGPCLIRRPPYAPKAKSQSLVVEVTNNNSVCFVHRLTSDCRLIDMPLLTIFANRISS